MTTAPFTVYDTITGEVLRTGRASEDDALLQASGANEAVLLDTLDAETQYLPGGTITNRPVAAFTKTTIAASGADVALLEIPGPFIVTIDGGAYEVEDSVEIASDMAATYAVRIDHFPYRPIDVDIVAS